MSAPGATDFVPLSALGSGGDPLIVNRRYRLADPSTGEQRDYTRVSTLLASFGSDFGLTKWTERGIIEGLALRPDLRSLLASAPGDKAVADEVLDAAKEAGGLREARRHGTAVHGALERHLTGLPLALADDEPIARDLEAVVALIEGEGLRVRRVEQVILHTTLGYAGRLDLLVEVELPDGRTVTRVADLKTGKDVGVGDKARKIEAQLAAYARCTHVRAEDGSLVDAQQSGLNIDTEVGYVIAVRDGAAELLEANLSSGWTDVLLAAKEHQRAAAARKTSMLPVGRRYVAPDPTTQAAQVLDDLRAAITECADPLVGRIIEQAPPAKASPEARLEAAIAGAFAELKRAPTEPARPTLTDAGAQHLTRLAEMAADLSERTATGRAKPKCSKCRQPGHRARTCAADVASEPEPEPQIADAWDVGPESPIVIASSETLCAHTAGWSRRESDGAWVCGDCGRPSEATVDAMRTGAPLPSGPEPVTLPIDPYSDRIKAAQSQGDLQALWSEGLAHGGWTDAHTALAAERAPGLPLVFLPF